MQRLAHIDVAEPRDDGLVEQRGLHAGLLALARRRQHRRVERIAERLRPDELQQRFGRQRIRRNDLHETEAARIVEGHRRARRHVEHDMVVARGLAALVMEFAGVSSHRRRG